MDPINSTNEYFSSYEDLEIHRLMLEDEPRTDAYKQAIFNNKAYFEGKTVMDVGCGTGILSIFCAQAGAAKVYAIEASNIANLARDVIKENKFENTIEVIHSKVEDVKLPDDIKVDVIVSEWMGFYLLHEGMLDSVIFARDKFLKEGGLIFPESATIYISPCSVPSLYEKWNDFHGVSMPSFGKQLRSSKNKPEIMCVEAEHILGCEEVALCWVNLKEDTVADLNSYSIQHVGGANKDGKFQGLCLWFTCVFPDPGNSEHGPVVLDTGPNSQQTHWKQTVIVLPEEQDVEVADGIAFKLDMTRDKVNERRYNLELTLLDPEAVDHPVPCSCNLANCQIIKLYTEKNPFFFDRIESDNDDDDS